MSTTATVLERDHYYVRYRARCEGEPRLRGDGRLRSTTLIPPAERLDEADAWRRDLGGDWTWGEFNRLFVDDPNWVVIGRKAADCRWLRRYRQIQPEQYLFGFLTDNPERRSDTIPWRSFREM